MMLCGLLLQRVVRLTVLDPCCGTIRGSCINPVEIHRHERSVGNGVVERPVSVREPILIADAISRRTEGCCDQKIGSSDGDGDLSTKRSAPLYLWIVTRSRVCAKSSDATADCREPHRGCEAVSHRVPRNSFS